MHSVSIFRSLLPLLLFAGSLVSQSYDDLVRAASASRASGDAKNAIEVANKAVAADGARCEAYVVRALAEMQIGDYDAARISAEAAIRLAPEDRRKGLQSLLDVDREQMVAKLVAEAESALEEKMWARAADAYSTAFEADSKRNDLGLRSAVLLTKIENYSRAIALAQKLLVCTDARVESEARDLLDKLRVVVEPDVKKALAAVHAAFDEGDAEKAAAELQSLDSTWPNHAEGCFLRAKLAVRRKQPKLALESLRAAVRSGFDNLSLLRSDEDVAELLGDPDAAAFLEQAFGKALLVEIPRAVAVKLEQRERKRQDARAEAWLDLWEGNWVYTGPTPWPSKPDPDAKQKVTSHTLSYSLVIGDRLTGVLDVSFKDDCSRESTADNSFDVHYFASLVVSTTQGVRLSHSFGSLSRNQNSLRGSSARSEAAGQATLKEAKFMASNRILRLQIDWTYNGVNKKEDTSHRGDVTRNDDPINHAERSDYFFFIDESGAKVVSLTNDEAGMPYQDLQRRLAGGAGGGRLVLSRQKPFTRAYQDLLRAPTKSAASHEGGQSVPRELPEKEVVGADRGAGDGGRANMNEEVRSARQTIIANYNRLQREYRKALEDRGSAENVTTRLFKELYELANQHAWLLPGKDDMVSDTVPMPAPELYQAIAEGNLKAVSEWLAASEHSIADVECVRTVGDISSSEGFTPLSAAARMGRGDIVIKLLDGGASVNGMTRLNRTALMEACEGGHLEVVRALLLRGADKSITSGLQNAQGIAKRHGFSEIVTVLRDRPRR